MATVAPSSALMRSAAMDSSLGQASRPVQSPGLHSRSEQPILPRTYSRWCKIRETIFKKMKIKLFAAALLVSCLTSGVSFGHSITQSKIDQIRPGYTTAADLVRLFGQPDTWSTDLHKNTSLEWFSSPGPGVQAYLPVVGSFLGGFDVHIQDLWVEVGADGRVRRFTVNGLDARRARTQPPGDRSK